MIHLAHNRKLILNILLAVLGVLNFLFPESVQATTQFSEIVYLNGQKYPLESLPLEQYYGPAHPRPKFLAPNTATWRGYIGTWEIDRGMLQLKAIRAWSDQGEVGLETLFPGQKGPIAATWFTGKLKVPQGKIVKPAVPYPIYEKYLLITFDKGRVIGQDLVDNPVKTRPNEQ